MVEFLAPAQASEFPEQWYELSRPDHFWFLWRLAAALGQIAELGIAVDQPLHVLDVDDGKVRAFTAFIDTRFFSYFGLSAVLER